MLYAHGLDTCGKAVWAERKALLHGAAFKCWSLISALVPTVLGLSLTRTEHAEAKKVRVLI